MADWIHPCLTCGACCATFRVSFYWAEIEGEGGVPAELTVPVTPFRAAMDGTHRANPRCVALDGQLGASVRCTIHPRRPTPCREFAASYEDGTPHERCDEARARHGLAPLQPSSWAR